MLDILSETEVVHDVIKQSNRTTSGQISQMDIFVFNDRLDKDLSTAPNIPNITPPEKANTEACIND